MANMRKTSSDTLKLRRLINSLKVRLAKLAEREKVANFFQVSGSELGSEIEQRASTFFSGVQIVKTGTSHRQVNLCL